MGGFWVSEAAILLYSPLKVPHPYVIESPGNLLCSVGAAPISYQDKIREAVTLAEIGYVRFLVEGAN